MADVLAGADDSPAIVVGSGGPAFTRRQLRRLTLQFAATLRASGVKPGDVVTIAEPNTVSRVYGLLQSSSCAGQPQHPAAGQPACSGPGGARRAGPPCLPGRSMGIWAPPVVALCPCGCPSF